MTEGHTVIYHYAASIVSSVIVQYFSFERYNIMAINSYVGNEKFDAFLPQNTI